MTHEEQARRLIATWEHGDETHRQWLRDIATPGLTAALTSAEAAGFARGVEAAAQVVVLKARENDMAAKNLKMPEGSASHLAANVYRNAEFAIRALIPETKAEDPNRLDLDAVPSGWRFHGLDRWNEAMTTYCCQLARLEGVIGVRYATGTGPTPSAALRAACEKAREG